MVTNPTMATNPTAGADAGTWLPTVSGAARLELSMIPSGKSQALRMAYTFPPGGGFVVARRAMPRSMPQDFAVQIRMRGRGSVDRLEIKLIDEGNQNVWRHVLAVPEPPSRWRRIRLDSSQFEFAWGPASDSRISRMGFLEFAVVAAQAGEGTLWLRDVEILDCSPLHPPTAHASSELPGFAPSAALEGHGWKPQPADLRPWLAVDCSERRVIGGLAIDWLGGAPSRGFLVQSSASGKRWKTLYTARKSAGSRSYVYLPGLRTRYLRLRIHEPTAGLAVQLQPYEFSRSIEAFWYQIAAAAPRGHHPRWLHREQTLWTVIGTPYGEHCALMNADGMVEPTPGSGCIEPVLRIGDRLYTWADVTPRQTLLDDWTPVPQVTWEADDWRLTIIAEALSGGALRIRYRVESRRAEPSAAQLFLLVRPFQVDPPWQHYRNLGGVSRIGTLAWRDGAVHVDDMGSIVPSTAPAGFAAISFDEGNMVAHLEANQFPEAPAATDHFEFASGALQFTLPLPAMGVCERAVICEPANSPDARLEPAFDWAASLPAAQWAGNGWIAEAIAAALTATAHILITRNGPALQPGPRRYTRSWIRDSTTMCAALQRMGRGAEVREFVRWYAPHQRADGFVPCCVDHEAIDWLVEHDSHGQLLALIADHHRFTLDRGFLEEMWPFVERAVGFIGRSLGSDGLMPISVSHEGYLAQPVHAYWDDFWALRGVRDAAVLAQMLGRKDLAQEWGALSTRLADAVATSVQTTRAQRHVDFIPGSVEWGDFDPTATANAVYLLGVPAWLDRTALDSTFDKYMLDWRNKRRGETPWANYTPYEIRIIGALVRLQRREDALELLKFFLSDRRPRGWNQWPEIAWRDEAAPAHLGDLPHTWISAEYVLAVRSLFAYEDEASGTLVVGAGLAPEWIDAGGVTVSGMATLYGSLSYTLRRIDSRTLEFEVDGGIRGAVILRPPLGAPLDQVRVGGEPYGHFDAESVTLLRTPASVTCLSTPVGTDAA
jgi:hypothetical protein